MNRPRMFVLLLCTIGLLGCQSQTPPAPPAESKSAQALPAPLKSLDFEALRTSVDSAIGKHMQTMNMEAMQSAAYQFDGPLKTAVDIVAPVAKAAGFTEATGDLLAGMGEAEKQMQATMGMQMKSVDQVMYTHPNGDTLMLLRTDVSNTMAGKQIETKLLTLQLMNPKQMSEMGAKMIKPEGETK